MTGRNRTPWLPTPGRTGRAVARRLGLAVGLLVVVLAGCKSKGGSGGSSAGDGGGSRDPLVHGPGRIPPQNVPVPDRALGGKGRGDPLLLSPTGRPGGSNGAHYSDDADRWKGPYLPGEKGTPAALAGKPRDDGEGLRIEAPTGSGLQPVGGFTTGGSGAAAVPESIARELQVYGWKRNDTTLDRNEKGETVLRVRVPISDTGALREYTGVGPTPADAARQVLELVKSDRK